MAKSKYGRVRILELYNILEMNTDESHPLTAKEIIEKLAERGIQCERKSVYKDINTLNSFGYEIMHKKKGKHYYYVVDRKFNVPELKILIDAVQCSNFITKNKSEEFTKKIAALAGTFKSDVLLHDTLYQNDFKKTNEQIYIIIDAIESAIENGKKISFKYFDNDIDNNRVYRRDGEKYLINPVKLTISDNKYYLICYSDKHPSLSAYRLDRMDLVEVTNIDKQFADCENPNNVKQYLTGIFSMFAGKKRETIELKCKNTIVNAEVLNDKFGPNKKIIKKDDDYFIVQVNVGISETFFAWLTTFGGDIQINFPSSIKEEYINFLENNISKMAEK